VTPVEKNCLRAARWRALWLLSLLWSCSAASGQSGALEVAAESHRVRFAVSGEARLLRLQVSAAGGEEVFDSGPLTTSTIEWNRHDRQGRPVPDGLYWAAVTFRDESGQVREATEQVVLGAEGEDPPPPETQLPARDISGAGTVGKVAKWITATTLGNSIITENAAKIGILQPSPAAVLHVTGTQPAAVAGNGTNATAGLTVVGGKGGNSTAAGFTAGRGGNLSLTSGAGGNAVGGGTNGSGGNITLQGGAPGTGGSGGARGKIFLNAAGGNVGIGTSTPWAHYAVTVAGGASPNGLYSSSTSGYGLGGVSGTSYGVVGEGPGFWGVYGTGGAGGVSGFSAGGTGVRGDSTTGYGVGGVSGSSYGVVGNSSGAYGVYGNGIYGGVRGESSSGAGVRGESTSGAGVQGLSNGYYGVVGTSGSHRGVVGRGPLGGVLGESTGGDGVQGWSNESYGVVGTSDSHWGVLGRGFQGGVRGEATSSVGVAGESINGTGVSGRSTNLFGVAGSSSTQPGVWGSSTSNAGVWAQSSTDTGLFAQGPVYAGYFNGKVHVTGVLTKGGGAFQIDHPLDPANKLLSHSFVESPDMKNIYDGVTTLDDSGEATVDLPNWFEALNRDFRYQLTCVGGYAPVYISQKVAGNRFRIAGGRPGLEVSWQVTGIRRDAYAEAHRIQVEEDKPDNERGYYLHPKEFGQPETKGIEALHDPGARALAHAAPPPPPE
jgi:hypothetical protein